jgi:hypothetical protein
VGSGPPGRACLFHYRTDEVLVKQDAVYGGQATPPVKEGTEHANVFAASLPTWLMCADQVSRVSRVIPRYRAVSTHAIGSPRN